MSERHVSDSKTTSEKRLPRGTKVRITKPTTSNTPRLVRSSYVDVSRPAKNCIQAVAQERRATLADLVVDVPAGRPDVIGIAFSVLPVGSVDPLDLAVEVAV